jgi:hypothetical protein
MIPDDLGSEHIINNGSELRLLPFISHVESCSDLSEVRDRNGEENRKTRTGYKNSSLYVDYKVHM